MNESPINKRSLAFTATVSLLVAFSLFIINYFNRTTKVVFCDVGQGDSAYIRVNNRVDVLIDAGPNKEVLSCLGRHMPFWDRKIEIAILSHHDKDHYGGYIYLLDRYKIDNFLTVDYRFDSSTYKKLVKKIKSMNINYRFVSKGQSFTVIDSIFRLYWPPIDLKSYDSNDFSLIFSFDKNDFRVLFSGDSTPLALNSLSDQSIKNINILKVPHHGSKNGLNKKFLDLADIKVAVISVGKNNSYGHPSKKILDMLKAKNIVIKRTDIDGDITFMLKESP